MPHTGIFDELFEQIDQGFCLAEMVVDDAGRPIDYRFLRANHLFEEMTGLRDAVGRTARELVPDLEDRWIQTYARAGLGGERLRFQMGSEAMGRWFDVFAMPLGDPGTFGIVFRDETARRRAEVARETLLAQEQALSRRLQQALLPTGVEKDDALTIEFCYESAESLMEVGGDWYDSFRWPSGEIGIMVGDVAGHDLEAAVMMGQLRAGTRVLATLAEPSPVVVLEALEIAASQLGDPDFVTAACVVVHPATGGVAWATSGHPAPLLVRADGSTRWLSEGHHPAVGLVAVRDAEPGRDRLEVGDSVVVFSDGLVETRDQATDDRLADLAQEAARLRVEGGLTPQALVRRMVGEHAADDVTVVVVTRAAR